MQLLFHSNLAGSSLRYVISAKLIALFLYTSSGSQCRVAGDGRWCRGEKDAICGSPKIARFCDLD